MIFAMAKEYALNLKRENHQRKQRRKARSNTMPKVTLELDMPESCAECLCKSTDVWGIRCRLIHIKSDKYSGMAEGYVYKRRPDCPLKLVEKGGDE